MARKVKPTLAATLEHGGLAGVQDTALSDEQLDILSDIVEGLDDEAKDTLLAGNTEVRIILRRSTAETWHAWSFAVEPPRLKPWDSIPCLRRDQRRRTLALESRFWLSACFAVSGLCPGFPPQLGVGCRSTAVMEAVGAQVRSRGRRDSETTREDASGRTAQMGKPP